VRACSSAEGDKKMTDNILVSREKWEDMVRFINCFTYEDSWARKVLQLPDFIDSEKDIDGCEMSIVSVDKYSPPTHKQIAEQVTKYYKIEE
jgi:hypothetical protein